MNNVLYVVGLFWVLFFLAGYWLMSTKSVNQDAGIGLLVISSLFGIDSYISNKIPTWHWWEQALLISSILACYISGIGSNRENQPKT